MKVTDALSGLHRVFLDTAPIIYHIESNPTYVARTRLIFQHIDRGLVEAVTSSISLMECLVHPLRQGDAALANRFRQAITTSANTHYHGIDAVIEKAAELRAQLNLTLPDALQVACALGANVDAFVTNDRTLARVPGLHVLVLDDLQA